MFGQFFFFIAGIALAGIVAAPIIYFQRKRIHKLEAFAVQSAKGESEFISRTINIASSIKDCAKSISLSDDNDYENVDGNIENIESTIAENTRMVTEISDKTNSVAAIAAKTEDDVQHGFAVLEKNIKKMQDIKEKNMGTINGIVSLSNKVNKIRDIVRIINTITDQTKAIAFNATLEAASAGEAGKRFSVIAGEVNRLADDIAVLTRQIREQAEEIQASSASLILYSEEGSDRIADGYKLIKDLEELFKEIRSSTEITASEMQTITVSAHHQLKSSEPVYAAINEVSQKVKHFAAMQKTVLLAVKILTGRTCELETFLSTREMGKQGEHGNR